MNFTPRPFVNGALLSRSTGKTISILVQPTSIDDSSRVLQVTTTDGIPIKVVMNDPLNAPVEDWMEVHGTVTSSDSINCSEIILFEKKENSKEFNPKNHNMLISFLTNVKDFDLMGDE